MKTVSICNMFRKVAIGLGLVAACTTLPACFGNKAPERSYFSIDYALSSQPHFAKPKYNSTLVIQSITSTLAYDRQEIVYRTNPYEFQYYWYRLWASKPRKLLNEIILGHLQYTNLFQSVSTTIEDRLPDYLLDVYIVSIEELDVSDKEWYAHMSLRFTLTRSSSSQPIWTYTFDAKRPVASNQPVYVVKAMSEMLSTELVKTFEALDQKLAEIEKSAPQNPNIVNASDDAAAGNQNNTNEMTFDDDRPSAYLTNKRSAD